MLRTRSLQRVLPRTVCARLRRRQPEPGNDSGQHPRHPVAHRPGLRFSDGKTGPRVFRLLGRRRGTCQMDGSGVRRLRIPDAQPCVRRPLRPHSRRNFHWGRCAPLPDKRPQSTDFSRLRTDMGRWRAAVLQRGLPGA